MPGILYIVATPIGNLDDMPPRVAATFGAADFVAAEDTRVTLKLLNHLGLKKPMMSYYEHALYHGAAILDRIEAGESCALCSDAGMPCISDPGEQIVKDAIARGITVTPVPGASACVTALAVSGQDTARFVFEGFLPVPKKERRERLEFLQGETRTVIFYEAPHKLRGTLDDLCAAFGAERSITLCRELTKLHEEITKTTIGEAVRYYEQNDPRGEYVLVMAGAPAAQAAAEYYAMSGDGWNGHNSQVERDCRKKAGMTYGSMTNLTGSTSSNRSTVAKESVTNWVNSDVHFQAMIDATADNIGVGVAIDANGYFWCVQVFGDYESIS